MDFPCYSCNTVTQLNLKFEPSYFSCPNCKSLYGKNEADQFVYKDKFKNEEYNNAFHLGQKGNFDGVIYTITSVLIKKHDGVKWAEYVLQNVEGKFVYLSEANGNFIVLEQIEFPHKVGNHPLTVTYSNSTLDRFDYYYPEMVFADGFFDFDVRNKIELIEYINPPYILSFERFEKEQTAFFGKHISRSKIKKAFDTGAIPSKTELGLVQPFIFNIRNLIITFSSVAILILISHWFLNKGRTQQEVLNVGLPFENYTNKEYISPSFELVGSSAPLEISVFSPVDNSWANVQVALINEKTNEEIYASKDVEYYHGYTDGESWKEGSTGEDFNICGVKAGKYHVAITPVKAPEDTSNSMVTVTASWNKPSLRNVFMVVLFMAIFVVIMYYLSRKYEDKRWGNYE